MVFSALTPGYTSDAGTFRTRLLDHLGGGNSNITKELPTYYVAEVTTNDVAREAALIVELQPLANKKIG